MTLQQFEVLVQVAKTGSFTKAGENLALTQSAISHIISAFENEIGFNLLYRNRGGIELTSDGKKIFEHALDILNRIELIRQEAAAIVGIETGILKIGCFPSISPKIFIDIIINYQKTYPKIELKIFEGSYEEIENWILNGTIDVGFSANKSKGLEFIPLWRDNLIAIVDKNNHLASKKVMSINDFQSQPYIMPKSGCDLLIKSIFKKHNINPNIKFEIENNNTLLAMVSKGVGISIIPEMVLNFNQFKLATIKLEPELYRTIGILIKSYNSLSPAAQAFIKYMQQNNEIIE